MVSYIFDWESLQDQGIWKQHTDKQKDPSIDINIYTDEMKNTEVCVALDVP